ncbi:glutamyl-tRNA amidotransferase [Burkholderia lata]|uniref:DUF1120 domain-containing protein n=1 Tax=Burkholderia lata (strain ATCC 17760 / DSM 23089 / LMG 22485 / NCIMB 9086 / R18194 / 383) TaxID=482957 RepID=UPI001453583E|nr:DUF1120 domain-containing protein [Burkholderia lata]VWD54584.1 glutamyl-tRNA amidotransferase [Burkholderia lata]
MKTKLYLAIAFPTLLTCSAAAFAQTSATLVVNGTITPPACEISIPSGSIVDFESRSFSELNVDGTKINPKDVAMNISCDAPTRVGLSITDDKAATKIAKADVASNRWAHTTPNDSYVFGLGTTGNSAEGGIKIGGLMLGFAGGTVNIETAGGSAEAGVIYTTDHTTTGNWSSDTTLKQYFSPSQTYSWATSGTFTPTPVTNVDGNISITPTIAKSVTLPTTDKIEFDGSITFNLVYL